MMAPLIPGALSARQAQPTCPHVARDQRPALLSFEGSPGESRLHVTYRNDGELQRQFIISARHLDVTRLDNAVFLINASERATASFVKDLEADFLLCPGLESPISSIHCL